MPAARAGAGDRPAARSRMRRAVLAIGLLALAALGGCGPEPPLRIGLMAGLSGRGANAAEDARNGAMLAVEQRNAAGGVRGRSLELIVQDDGHSADTARAAVQALQAARVEAIVGPLISSVAMAVLPQIDAAQLLMLSPTAAATELAGRDDYLFRLNSTTRDNAHAYADVLDQRGQRRVSLALATDTRHAAYSSPWRDAFRERFEALGGVVTGETGFVAGPNTPFAEVVHGMLAGQPDGLLFIAGPVEVARLAQQAYKLAPQVPMAAAEAAASEALVEFGGQAVDGLLLAQPHNRNDASPRFLRFRDAYGARFGRVPGDHAVAAHDAVTVLAEAMAARQGKESLKQAVLRHGPFQGLQQPLAFDRYGDMTRPLHFVLVHGGRFERIP